MRLSAPRLNRLTKRSEFQAAAGDGRRFRTSALGIQVRERQDEGGVRIGLTASRHTGSATERNRIRRRLRAAAREAFAGVAIACDIVAVARREALTETYDALVRALAESPRRARAHNSQRARQKPAPAGPEANGTGRARQGADADKR
jgi:ribonuclease P protein component